MRLSKIKRSRKAEKVNYAGCSIKRWKVERSSANKGIQTWYRQYLNIQTLLRNYKNASQTAVFHVWIPCLKCCIEVKALKELEKFDHSNEIFHSRYIGWLLNFPHLFICSINIYWSHSMQITQLLRKESQKVHATNKGGKEIQTIQKETNREIRNNSVNEIASHY